MHFKTTWGTKAEKDHIRSLPLSALRGYIAAMKNRAVWGCINPHAAMSEALDVLVAAILLRGHFCNDRPIREQ